MPQKKKKHTIIHLSYATDLSQLLSPPQTVALQITALPIVTSVTHADKLRGHLDFLFSRKKIARVYVLAQFLEENYSRVILIDVHDR